MNVLDSFSLAGKVAFVTGGAGIYGRHIASGLAEAGATVYIGSRNIESLKEAADDLRNSGLAVRTVRIDQADESSVLAAKQSILAECAGVDILVNNAVLRPMKGGYTDDASTFAESMQVNATGLFVITRAFGDAMAQKGSGSIINIGSIQGMVGPDPTIYEGTGMHGWYPDYFFHKGGMINFTRFIASYYGASGVRCNCLSPGGFQTPGHHQEFVRNYGRKTCLGRLAGENDIKGAVVFLASDASLYITGTNIAVDGGYTAK